MQFLVASAHMPHVAGDFSFGQHGSGSSPSLQKTLWDGAGVSAMLILTGELSGLPQHLCLLLSL